MRIDLNNLAVAVDQVLDAVLDPGPNGRIVTTAGADENDYGESDFPSTAAIPVWFLPSTATSRSNPEAAGSRPDGEIRFTARGTTRHPTVNDVVEVAGVRYRVTELDPDHPQGRYVTGKAERVR